MIEAFACSDERYGSIKEWLSGQEAAHGGPGDVLVLSCDGKGVAMRPEGLRRQTMKQAESSQRKLQTRLSRGEKRGRKRIAEVTSRL
ncbi:MAG: hypothetical protein ACYCUM_03010 [Solirubrobacteraceae bacterium]